MLLGRVFPKMLQPFPLAVQSCFFFMASMQHHMGQGQAMPFRLTMDQSLVSFGWEGATKARIWPLAIFQGLLTDLGVSRASYEAQIGSDS